ncbi:MAG: hypothetical protein N2662_00575 [Bacteroidales bacterium]|nr:hypothetical protein [Bacteroidales bacterium]
MGYLHKVYNFLSKNKTTITILMVVLLVANINKNIGLYNKENCIIDNDVISYYAYLPAFFIYHDIGLTFKDSANFNCNYTIWGTKTNTGRYVIKTTMGVAIAYMPFFLITHCILKFANYEACGFSPPYKIALIASSLFFLLIGFIFIKRTLKMFIDSDWLIVLTILILGFGTNLYFYSTYSPAYSHVYSFALISIFIYYSILWVKDIHNIKLAVFLGLLIGWISLIRPTNAVIAVFTITLFFSHRSIKDLYEILRVIVVIIILAIVVWIPQFLYWKYVTGNYFYYSYADNERFFFDNPHIISGLFGFRKGFFIYTPVMIFSFIGFYHLYKKSKHLFFSVLLTTIIYLYVTLSWWCWWYGGSLGMRPFIDFYSLWSLSLASFLYFLSRFRIKVLQYVLFACVVLFSFLNLEYTKQIRRGGLHYDSMTWEAYKCTFLSNSSCDFYSLLCPPDYELAKRGIDRCNKSN